MCGLHSCSVALAVHVLHATGRRRVRWLEISGRRRGAALPSNATALRPPVTPLGSDGRRLGTGLPPPCRALALALARHTPIACMATQPTQNEACDWQRAQVDRPDDRLTRSPFQQHEAGRKGMECDRHWPSADCSFTRILTVGQARCRNQALTLRLLSYRAGTDGSARLHVACVRMARGCVSAAQRHTGACRCDH